jgi:hypothetical protein
MGAGAVAANVLRFSAAVMTPALGALVKGKCDSSALEGKAGDRQRLATLAFSICMQVLGSTAAKKLATSLSGSKSKAMRRFKKPVTIFTKTFSYALSPAGGYLLGGSSVAAKLRRPKENGKAVFNALTCMDVFGRIFTWKPWVTINTPESFNLLGLLSRSTASTLKTELEKDGVKNSFWVTGIYDDSQLEELHRFGMRIAAIVASEFDVDMSTLTAPDGVADKVKLADYYFNLSNLFSNSSPDDATELQKGAVKKLHSFALNANVHAHLQDLDSQLKSNDFWLATKEEAEQKAKDVDLAEIHKQGFEAVQVLQKMVKQPLVSTTSSVDATTQDSSDLLAFYTHAKDILDALPLPEQLRDVKEKIGVLIKKLKMPSADNDTETDTEDLETADADDVDNRSNGQYNNSNPAADLNGSFDAAADHKEIIKGVYNALRQGHSSDFWKGTTDDGDISSILGDINTIITMVNDVKGDGDKILELNVQNLSPNHDPSIAIEAILEASNELEKHFSDWEPLNARLAYIKQQNLIGTMLESARHSAVDNFWDKGDVNTHVPFSLYLEKGKAFIDTHHDDLGIELEALPEFIENNPTAQYPYFKAVYNQIAAQGEGTRDATFFDNIIYVARCNAANSTIAHANPSGDFFYKNAVPESLDAFSELIYGESGVQLCVDVINYALGQPTVAITDLVPPVDGDLTKTALSLAWDQGYNEINKIRSAVTEFYEDEDTLLEKLDSIGPMLTAFKGGAEGGDGDTSTDDDLSVSTEITAGGISAVPIPTLDSSLDDLAEGKDAALWRYEDRKAFLDDTPRKDAARPLAILRLSTALHQVLSEYLEDFPVLPERFGGQSEMNKYWRDLEFDVLNEKAQTMINHLIMLSDVNS